MYLWLSILLFEHTNKRNQVKIELIAPLHFSLHITTPSVGGQESGFGPEVV